MKWHRMILPLLGLLVMLFNSACTVGGDKAASGKVALNVGFQKSSGKRLAAATLQELGIARVTLDVIPASNSSVNPGQIDLFAIHQQTNSYNHTINNLTDGETYLFRITAYDTSDNRLYSGQTSAVLQPNTTNAVELYAYSFTGFNAVAGTWNFTATDTATRSSSLTVDMGGTMSGSGLQGQVTCWLSPDGNGKLNVYGVSRPLSAGGTTSLRGSIDPATGLGSGTGTNPFGEAITWTSAKTGTANAYVGIYKGTAVATTGATGAMADIEFAVDEFGSIFGNVIDITDNNRLYALSGAGNSATGTVTSSFTLTSGAVVTLTGSPTSGTWTRAATGQQPAISGTYSTARSDTAANPFVGIFRGICDFTLGGNGIVATLKYGVNSAGIIVGTAIDINDNNRVLPITGTVAVASTGITSMTFTPSSGGPITFGGGGPSSGSWSQAGTGFQGGFRTTKLGAGQPLVGTWWFGDLTGAKKLVVVTFLSDGTYMLGQTGPSDGVGQSGVELGRWDATGTLDVFNIQPDTNGEWGLSHPQGGIWTASVSGNTLTLSDSAGSSTAQRLMPSATNRMIGSWIGSDFGVNNNYYVITFINDTHYFFVETVPSTSTGTSGVQLGTYTTDGTTGFTATSRIVNTVGASGPTQGVLSPGVISADKHIFNFKDGADNLITLRLP